MANCISILANTSHLNKFNTINIIKIYLFFINNIFNQEK